MCGFGIRYGKSRNNVKGVKSMKEFLCNCDVSTFLFHISPHFNLYFSNDGVVYIVSVF